MANEQNLQPGKYKLSQEEAKRGGKASGESRRRKKTIKAGIKAMMEEGAPEKIKAAFAKSGYDVDSNYDAIIASILMGAIKGNPKMVDRVIEMIGEDAKTEMARQRLKLEKKKAALEAAKQKAVIEAVKAQQAAQMEDDGFLEALKGTASEDWGEEDDD